MNEKYCHKIILAKEMFYLVITKLLLRKAVNSWFGFNNDNKVLYLVDD